MKRLGKFLFITSLLLCFLIPRGWTQTQAKNQPDSIELKLKEIYTKREVMIPMRDGIKLTPLSTNRKTTAGSILS
mgnify:CR=1 FL=1